MRNTFCAFLFLHCDPAQSICHRADQDNGRKDGAQILDHEVEDLFTAEGLAAQRHLFFDPVSYTHLDVYKRQALKLSRPLKIEHAFFSHVPVMMSHVRNKCDDLPLRE